MRQPVVPCAGAVVFDEQGRLLLVRRGRAPARGRWCEPSGRCEPGENAEQACVRETAEETGVQVRVLRELGSVTVTGAGDADYLITDFLCEQVGGTLHAGDDAADVRWVDRAGFDTLPLVDGLAETFARWGCLPG